MNILFNRQRVAEQITVRRLAARATSRLSRVARASPRRRRGFIFGVGVFLRRSARRHP